MFRPYRTLKLKVPCPCCPWCQAHLERIEQKLQALEEQLQELSTRLATPLTTTGEAVNVSAGFLKALQVSGLASSSPLTGEEPRSQVGGLAKAFSAYFAALDRLGETSARPVPPNLVPPSPKTLSPHQFPQIRAPQSGSGRPAGDTTS